MDIFEVLGSRSLFSLPLKWGRRWRAHDDFWQSLCVLGAMTTAMLLCGLWGQMPRCIPLFLGIIACALSERDELPRQRIVSLLLTLASFAVAAIAIELLMPHPALFVIGLGCSSFAITLFGGVGGRFNTMMSSMLVLALYSMITIDQRQDPALVPFWRDGVLLLTGALGYGVLSLLVLMIAHHRTLPRHLATLYAQIGDYMILKSEQFIPVQDEQKTRQRERQLAERHGALVQAFGVAADHVHQTLTTSRNSVRAVRDKLLLERAEHLFERASSSHHSRTMLLSAFYHSDILFRCQRLMQLQGEACRSLASVLHRPERARTAFVQHTQALDDLLSAWRHVAESTRPAADVLPVDATAGHHLEKTGHPGAYRVLEHLVENLAALEEVLTQLPEVGHEAREAPPHPVLLTAVSGPADMLRRVRLMMTPHNPTFRHAVRLSCALVTGYLLIQWLDPSQGYWVMLTTVFVCRPSFGATHKALRQRILGTLAGLFMGWAMLRLFPMQELQAGMAVIAGVMFFLWRQKHYALATSAITLMVLCCFNQIGNSFTLIWPRLLDTLLGTVIAGAAVCFILPDWRGARIEPKAATALTAMAAYLRQLIDHYLNKTHDKAELLAAGQAARQSDAALVALLANLDQIPYRGVSVLTVAGFQLHSHLHALLGYMVALGVHRPPMPQPSAPALEAFAAKIITALENMAAYIDQVAEPLQRVEQGHLQHIAPHEALSDGQRFAYQQLETIARHLEPMQSALREMRTLLD